MQPEGTLEHSNGVFLQKINHLGPVKDVPSHLSLQIMIRVESIMKEVKCFIAGKMG